MRLGDTAVEGPPARRRRHPEESPWAATARALLRHYDRVGFTGAPTVVGSGVTTDGLAAVRSVEGTSPHPHAWPDEALPALGELLRRAHDAGATSTPAPDAQWQLLFSRTLPGTRPVIGHGDVGPWNVLAQPGGDYALTDWEFAGPVDAVWDLAQAAWLNAQLHDDDVEFAVRAARAEAVEQDVTADSPAITDSGFPVLWAITWCTRSAAWMFDHRRLLERALA